MPLEHVNRRGVRYFVMQGKTKTGKTKYYCGRKLNAEGVTELPPELEIYEHPATAIVTIRKVKHTRLLPDERTFLEEQVRKLSDVEAFLVEKDEDSLIVYTSVHDRAEVDQVMMILAGPNHPKSLRQSFVRDSVYQPMFRFTLVDEDQRLFSLARWCFRGAIDGWISIFGPDLPLDELAAESLPHLGQESFYELI